MKYLKPKLFIRLRGPDAHLLEARHNPKCIGLAKADKDPPQKLSLLNLLQMAKDVSAGMTYLSSMVRSLFFKDKTKIKNLHHLINSITFIGIWRGVVTFRY